VIEQAQHLLQRVFGYQRFRQQQQAIIESVLHGQDALVLMPTGGGKSLCYQIPALVRDGVGIVVSPLIALMQDQVSALRQLGIRAAFINSSLDFASIQAIERQLIRQELDLLYIAPERLLTPHSLNLLSRCPLALFAIDEAHCVSQWGHDFRPEYQQLSMLSERFPAVPRIALTATADQRTRDEIIEQLQLQQAKVFISSFDRPNIRYAIQEGQNAKQELWRFIMQEHAYDAGIVYCLSRKKVEATAEWLTEKGRLALPYHAGMSTEQRQQHQERFLREEGIIIVATIAFGMGIDKPDVRFVAHLNLPKSIEAYYQETGRAGRDGEPANAWMAYGLQDVITLRQFMQESNADEQHKQVEYHKLDAMLSLCERVQCRRQALLHYFDEPLDEPCGNCDNCLSPPETWDAKVAAQKALSCVYRTGQRFGVNYVIDVLLAKNEPRIKSFGHDKLSTYGLGTDMSQKEWRSVFRQLIAQRFLDIDIEQYGALHLTEKARPLLRGEVELQLRRSKSSDKKSKQSGTKKTIIRKADETLWEALREKRQFFADQFNVPPYVIFHDATLQLMLQKRPQSLAALRTLNGVGERKLKHYGKGFLAVLLDYPRHELLNNRLSDTVNETLYYYTEGLAADAIAKQRQLKLSTIYGHFSDAIEMGLIEPLDVLPLDKPTFDHIVDTFQRYSNEDKPLKSTFEALEEAYDYGLLRCVLAAIAE